MPDLRSTRLANHRATWATLRHPYGRAVHLVREVGSRRGTLCRFADPRITEDRWFIDEDLTGDQVMKRRQRSICASCERTLQGRRKARGQPAL